MPELIFPSFIAGLLTFLAPCTLPLVPAYLTFISGSGIRNLKANKTGEDNKAKVFLNGLFFVVGFSFVFILLGLFAGTLGGIFMSGKIWLSRIGGLFIVFFGLMMLDFISIPQLLSEKKIFINTNTEKRGTYSFSFLLGVVFGSGWTPCIGPVLGSILILASSSSTAFSGAVLLSFFSLGLAIPFLLIALGVGKAQKIIDRYSHKLGFINKIGGILLVILGLALLTNHMNFFTQEIFKFLEFINYDGLMKYL